MDEVFAVHITPQQELLEFIHPEKFEVHHA
jgi:hypothetical protein